MPDQYPSKPLSHAIYVFVIVGVVICFLVLMYYSLHRGTVYALEETCTARVRRVRVRPRCHQVWLSPPGQECMWRDVQPLSIQKISSSTYNGGSPALCAVKTRQSSIMSSRSSHASSQKEKAVLSCATPEHFRVAVFVAMPSPSARCDSGISIGVTGVTYDK